MFGQVSEGKSKDTPWYHGDPQARWATGGLEAAQDNPGGRAGCQPPLSGSPRPQMTHIQMEHQKSQRKCCIPLRNQNSRGLTESYMP